MNKSLMTIISTFILAGLLTPTMAAEADQWLWASPTKQARARHLAIDVSTDSKADESGRTHFRCDIASDFSYRGASVTLRVRDTMGAIVNEGFLPLDISAGANTCTITLDTSGLPLGSYIAEFSVAHTSIMSEPSHTFVLRNVTAADMRSQLDQYTIRASELTAALDNLEAGSKTYPYLRLRANLVTDVLKSARQNSDRKAWETLEEQLRYANERLNAIHAGMVFGDTSSEQRAARPTQDLDNLFIQDGAFMAGTRPVFLFGGALPEPDADVISLLARYQLNAATLTIQPDANPVSEHSAESLEKELAPVFQGAQEHNVGLALQLAPRSLVRDSSDAAAPLLASGNRVDIASPNARDLWENYLREIGPVLRDQDTVLGVSLAIDPHFHFEGKETKAGFLDFLRANYPDRLTLNRAWRAHLASLEDITLWSQGPYDTYQTHRPYKFDWQTYHQSLGDAYFRWSRNVARSHLAATPLMVTQADDPFKKGEVLYGVNREKLADIMQISACEGANSAANPIYAMDYPRQSAHYTLLRSLDKDKPIFNLNSAWELPERATSTETYRLVHSTMWEGMMSGLSGVTTPVDSLFFQQPEALEAFATAALDVNRLAPVVLAFQNAPTDVGILFSQSSKVFDEGDPHLKSALNAFEGSSFGGYNVRFITEEQCAEGALENLKILVIPDTPAVSNRTFDQLNAFVEAGGTVARTGAPIPYNSRGFSRDALIQNTANTVLVRGLNLPTEYLHAMDAATVLGALPQIPRTVTRQGYPIEGVKSRFIEFQGEQYLYVLNLRKEPTYCTLATQTRTGRDLIHGEDVTFPTTLEPLVPMLIKLEPVRLEMTVTAAAE
jgi:hypothetical protein